MIRNIGFMHHRRKKTISDIVENKIIENNSVSLEEILSEETLIDELQNKNPNLLKYLTKEKTKQIIYYIIEEPSDDAPHDRGHKYPWVCTQLLTVENSPILKYLYKTNKELSEENKENNDKMDLENNERNNDNKIELLDYLLTFLKTDKEPNYVLCGYFASIIKALLQAQPTIIINYFYKEKKECIKQLINYSYRESISEILNKIFQYDISVEEFNIEEIDLFRMELLEELFCTLDINMNNEKLDSISTLIKNLSTEENLFTDLLNNKIIIHNLITKPLKDINLLISDKSKEIEIIKKRRNFIIIIDIIINWIKSINTLEIDIPSTTDESEDDNKDDNINNNFSHTLLSYELFNILLNLIKINFNKHEDNNNNETKVLQCFDEKKLVPLGLFRVKIVELLGCLFSYFKNIPNLYDKILIESEFFQNAINYLFEYEFNNIYQESLLFLFKKYLDYSEYHPLLSELLFTKINLTEIIISKIKLCLPKQDPDSNIKKDSFTYSSGNTTNRGYISFLISLAYKINTIIGGDPMRINDTLSREGSISFINRAQPFVPKEEITKFYGMEENELYEDVSNDSGNKKSSKLNCSVKCMEKYLNDNWNEFFYEYISDKIKLYETQLYKDDNNRDSLFRNPFILEEDDEKVESRLNNFGIGEDQDFLAGKNKKPDFNKILYGDADIDINNNNRFKMSMRLPRSNNNANLNTEKKRNSLGDKPKQVMVDEIDNFDNNNEEEKDDKINNEENEEKEEENPLDAFNKNKNEVKDKEDNDDPFANFQKKDDNRKISLISFRKKKKEEKIENQDDNNDNDNDILMENNNNEQNEEENPLDKLRNRILPTKEEKMDIEKNSDNLYDNNEDEDVFKNIKKEENKPDNNNNDDLYDNNEDEDAFKNIKKEENKPNNNNNNDDLYDNSEDEDAFKNIKKEENKLDNNNNDDLYDNNEDEDAFKNIKNEENKLDTNNKNDLYDNNEDEDAFKNIKKEENKPDTNNNDDLYDNNEDEDVFKNIKKEENKPDINNNDDLYDDNEEEDAFKNIKKEENKLDNNNKSNSKDKLNEDNLYEEEEEENPLDKLKKENNDKNNNKEINVNEKENENEEEDPFSKFKKEKNENINENNLDKINNENISKEDKTEKGEEDEEENPLDKFNRENQNKIKNDKEKKEKTEEKKEENIDDLLYETKEGDDGKEIEVDTEEKK